MKDITVEEPLENTVEEPSKPASPLQMVAGIIGAVGGYLLVSVVPSDISIPLVAGTIAGVLCGLCPFFLAKKRGNLKLAKIAIWSCALSGTALGLLLALPVAVVFTIVSLVQKPEEG